MSYFNLDKYGTNPGRHLLQTNLVRSLWGGLTATLVFLLLKATNAVKKYILQTPGQLLFHLDMYQIVGEISLVLPNKCKLQTLINRTLQSTVEIQTRPGGKILADCPSNLTPPPAFPLARNSPFFCSFNI